MFRFAVLFLPGVFFIFREVTSTLCQQQQQQQRMKPSTFFFLYLVFLNCY